MASHLFCKRIPVLLQLVLLILLTATLPVSAASTQSGDNQGEIPAGSDVNSLMAGLSDEQVRQLLIEELQKAGDTSQLKQDTADGPGAFISDVLSSLETSSNDTDGQVKALLGHLPNVVPDLYKVFVTL